MELGWVGMSGGGSGPHRKGIPLLFQFWDCPTDFFFLASRSSVFLAY